MRVVGRIALLSMFLGAALGCEAEEPCDRYVEYMCECHDGGDISCSELTATYVGADAEVQDQCAISLADQEDLDDENPDFDCFGTAESTESDPTSTPTE